MKERMYYRVMWIAGLIQLLVILGSCHKDSDDFQNGMWCTCEIELDGDSEYITFYMKGCQYCCWSMTMKTRDCRVRDQNPDVISGSKIDSIGNQFYTQMMEEDPVCEWEGVECEWGFGQPKN